MSRFRGLMALLLLASASSGQEPRMDSYGDPLPAGAVRRFGTVRFRQEFVSNMVFTPDGKSLVAGGSDRVVKWEVATGKPLRTIPASPAGGSYAALRLRWPVRRCPAERHRHRQRLSMTWRPARSNFASRSTSPRSWDEVSPDGSQVAVPSARGNDFLGTCERERNARSFAR